MAKEDSRVKKLEELQEEYSKTKYNKATNKHLGLLRAKMAGIRKAIEESRKKGGGFGFSVKKSGNATVALVGFPNAGKSSLLRLLTGVDTKVADYAFTTVEVIPGMLEYNGANIQFLDLPGLIQGAHVGKGGGREIVSVIRVSDLILFVVDVNAIDNLYKLLDELYALNVRVNKRVPKIRIEKAVTGGILIEKGLHKVPDKESIIECMNGFGIYNGTIIFHQDATVEDIIEIVAGNCVYIKGLTALNKIDTVSNAAAERSARDVEARTQIPVVKISAAAGTNIDALKEEVFTKLDLLRIYLKPRDGEADMQKPMVLNGNGTVMDVARKINSKTAKNVKFAHVTGRSAKFSNQRVGIEHRLADKDIVTLIYDKE
ncbi:MAG: 50S ribosome-binding GTPase [Candidatus Micrarchaeota archaeon]|nr:50S ribosome-binding GTPase [Candidatus Micrarchaeota archaeon]